MALGCGQQELAERHGKESITRQRWLATVTGAQPAERRPNFLPERWA